jgi:hypothetical protein
VPATRDRRRFDRQRVVVDPNRFEQPLPGLFRGQPVARASSLAGTRAGVPPKADRRRHDEMLACRWLKA